MKADHYNKGRQAFTLTVERKRKKPLNKTQTKKGEQKHGKNHKQVTGV